MHHHRLEDDKQMTEAEFFQDLKGQIQALGYRFTPQRQQIISVFLDHDGHLTAKDVTEHIELKDSSIDQATVYRNLEFFHKLGILYSSLLGGQTVYEMAQSVPHHHLVCRRCHGVEPLDDHHFDELVKHLLHDHQFKAEISHLTISGLCAECL